MFAKGYRLGRAIWAAVTLIGATVWMAWARSHPPTSVGKATALVTEVLEGSPAGNSDRVVRIRLDDGRDARLLVPLYAATEGARVPLVVESHAGGDTYLTFDLETWVDGAAGR